MSKRILSLLALLALSACGSAEESAPFDDEDGQAEEEDSFDSAQGAVTGAKCSTMNAESIKVFDAINKVRTKMGMPAINCDDKIQKAAIAHAKYQGLNQPGHGEVKGNPGFTGEWQYERMKAAGYPGYGFVLTEVICGTCDGAMSVDTFMTSVYHRSPFVSFRAKGYGYGGYFKGGKSQFSTIDFSNGASAPSPTKRAVWPVNGATSVPRLFDCSTESPNPCDDGLTEVGYPISLTGGSALTVTSTKFIKKGNATNLPHMVREHVDDPYVPEGQVFIIPKAPLKPLTTYTVTVKGSLDNSPFTHTWSFTTE